MISDSFFIVCFGENNTTDSWLFLLDVVKHLFYSACFKKYHETGHMLTVAYQPNHRYRKDWRLLMKESVDSWFATINYFDTYLKNL